MTIEEAIKELEEAASENVQCHSIDYDEAVHLGIEALKKWQVLREGRAGVIDPLLPGETRAEK